MTYGGLHYFVVFQRFPIDHWKSQVIKNTFFFWIENKSEKPTSMSSQK